jgi:hypothetical protein
MSTKVAGNGVIYSRYTPVSRSAADRLAFTTIHDFLPAYQSASFCGFCLCPYDDWRHLTPIAPKDRLFIR